MHNIINFFVFLTLKNDQVTRYIAECHYGAVVYFNIKVLSDCTAGDDLIFKHD